MRLGLHPRPRWGSLRRSPRPPNRICSGASRPRLARFAVSLLGSLKMLPIYSIPTTFFTTTPLPLSQFCTHLQLLKAIEVSETQIFGCNPHFTVNFLFGMHVHTHAVLFGMHVHTHAVPFGIRSDREQVCTKQIIATCKCVMKTSCTEACVYGVYVANCNSHQEKESIDARVQCSF